MEQKDYNVFYDIESLKNIFTLGAWYPHRNLVKMWFMDDTGMMEMLAKDGIMTADHKFIGYQPVREAIYEDNKNFNGDIQFYDLRTYSANDALFREFGAMLPDRNPYPPQYRMASDVALQQRNLPVTYYMGYNSTNYDMSELAFYQYETLYQLEQRVPNAQMMPPSAYQMRMYNDDMFTKQFKSYMPGRLACTRNFRTGGFSKPNYDLTPWKMRKASLLTGRHIDVSELNEKQKRVGLKRLCGMIGLQILESETLDDGYVKNINDLLKLIAYNVSDIINLEKLYWHRPYFTTFELKKGMLETYPEMVFEKRPDAYAPDINTSKIRKDRLKADSTSAKIATTALCPYGRLDDIPTVSFMYPDPEIAQKLGIQPFNVMDRARSLFHTLYPGEQHKQIHDEFDVIYNFYKSIEGKNFNQSQSYLERYRRPDGTLEFPALNINDFDDGINTNLFYYGPDGKPTSCFANFSTGGIHGQEANTALFDYHMWKYEEGNKELAYVKALYPDPLDAMKAKKVIMPDGTERKTKAFMKSGAKMSEAYYKDQMMEKPSYFKKSTSTTTGKVSWKLNPDYSFTTAALCNHEDFSSYYPNMLINMAAFKNPGLGYDRYNEIYDQKETLGVQMEDESIPEDKRKNLKNKRNGTKLILNSATGAGDAKFESVIRMNNRIISMRCIGQVFSWMVGQTQAHAGARIPSTNTDGLYTIMEEEENNRLLEQVSKDINIRIDPELVILISKDTNNRMEIGAKGKKKGKILDAKGGSLSGYEGPPLEQAFSHPAILDYALTQYLPWAMEHNMLHKPADMDKAREIIQGYDKENWMLMFQNVVASSPGTDRYVYASVKQPDGTRKAKKLQHYNRVFYIAQPTDETIWLQIASGKKITPAMKKKRAKEGLPMVCNQPEAAQILKANGVSIEEINQLEKEATTVNISGIKGSMEEKPTECLIVNENLSYLPEGRAEWIRENLDYDYYIKLFMDTYAKNWMNKMPPEDWDPNYSSMNPAPQAQPGLPHQESVPVPAMPETEPAPAAYTEEDGLMAQIHRRLGLGV